MYAVMWLCCAARRLVETGPFCCFPRGGWPWRLEPAEWVPGGCRGVFVAVSVIEKDQDLISWPNLLFFLCVFLPLRHSFWHILSSQTDNKVNSASGCHLLANVIQHQTRLLYSVTLRWRRKQNTTLYYTRSTKNKGQYWLTKVWFFFFYSKKPAHSIWHDVPLTGEMIYFYCCLLWHLYQFSLYISQQLLVNQRVLFYLNIGLLWAPRMPQSYMRADV